jgi:hypothetical protein
MIATKTTELQIPSYPDVVNEGDDITKQNKGTSKRRISIKKTQKQI